MSSGSEESLTSSPPVVHHAASLTTASSAIYTFNAASQMPLKLSSTNFPSWRATFRSLLLGYDLLHFIDEDSSCPSSSVVTDGVAAPNPAFSIWFRQDKLILHAILASVTEQVVPLVASSSTSREAWLRLVNLFASNTRSRVMQLKNSLSNLKKASLSIASYLQRVKEIADDLALAGNTISIDDLIIHVLNGLDSDYRDIAAAIRARATPLTFEELHDMLIDHETYLSRESPLLTTPLAFPSAHFSRVAADSTPLLPTPSGPRGSAMPYRGNPGVRRPPRKSPPVCQYCDKPGHTAKTCFKLHPSKLSQKSVNTVSSSSHPPQRANWIMDTGATDHVTSELSNLSFISDYDGPDELTIGDGSGLPITHTGTASLRSANSIFTLSDVLCVPDIDKNLISVSKFCSTNNVSIEFFASHFLVKDLTTGVQLLRGRSIHDLYYFPSASDKGSQACIGTRVLATDWHRRLGHPSSKVLQFFLNKFSIKPTLSSSFLCDSCECNKSHRLPFQTTSIISHFPLEVIYSDIWGPSPICSFSGFRYYVIFVDQFTKYIWYFPMHHKTDLYKIFASFKLAVEKRFERQIKTLYSDNGSEYLKLRSALTLSGIQHLTSPPYTPEHNGMAERRHRHIVETGQTLLHQALMPSDYWCLAFETAVYLINRLPTPGLHFKSSFECLFGISPNYKKLRVFGCLCYPWLRPYAKHKLEPKSRPCVFVGYSSHQSAYKCFDLSNKRFFISRHVQFDEQQFPFSDSSKILSSLSPITNLSAALNELPPVLSSPLRVSPSSPPLSASEPSSAASPLTDHASSSPVEAAAAPPALSLPPTNTHPMVTRSKDNIYKPKVLSHTTKHSLPPSIEPTRFTQALRDPNWHAAMVDEYQALLRNQTWDLVPSSPGMNVVGCKWVYRLKRKSDGSLDRYKARLVAKGFHQQPGVDYKETFSPVVKPTTIRVVLCLALSYGWSVNHFDVNNAFLQGNLLETVYMSQPPGFVHNHYPQHVCRLRKAIYGLKQAPRAWYHALRGFLLSFGFKNAISDTSLFIYHHDSVMLYFLVYVDDILLTGNNRTVLTQFIDELSRRFSLKDLGPLQYFLGIELTHVTGGIVLSQTRYVRDLLTRFHMDGAKSSRTPLSLHHNLCRDDGSSLVNATEFRSLVGALQYLSLTRPDIAFSVNKLAQYMSTPRASHLSAAKRVLRYLKHTLDMGLFLRSCSNLNLTAFCDSDFGGDLDDRRSTSAYVLYLGSNPISWKSTKQRSVSRSSTEAEFKAIAATCAELTWLRNLLHELCVPSSTPPTIFCDNLGATYFSRNPVFHSRMKHLALDYYFVREQVQAGNLLLQHVRTTDQLADILTKSLPSDRHCHLRSKLSLVAPNTSLRGHVKDNI